MRVAVILLIAALAVAGCGRKGDPVAPSGAAPAEATDKDSADMG